MGQFQMHPLGDSAISVLVGDKALSLAAHVRSLQIPGVTDVVIAFDHLGIYFEPSIVDFEVLQAAINAPVQNHPIVSKTHVVPICYELGNDLDYVCESLSTETIRYHLSHALECLAIGFCPGFPYLGWLDPVISGLPRKTTPATRVEPGTVAIVGNLCGIYPMVRPGGWWQIGRTPLEIVYEQDNYFPIRVGDKVEFARIDELEFSKLLGERL